MRPIFSLFSISNFFRLCKSRGGNAPVRKKQAGRKTTRPAEQNLRLTFPRFGCIPVKGQASHQALCLSPECEEAPALSMCSPPRRFASQFLP